MPKSPTHSLSITDQTAGSAQYAAQLEDSLHKAGYCICRKSANGSDINKHPELIITARGLILNMPQEDLQAIIVDFCDPSFLYRIAKGGGRKQPLAKAIGLKANCTPHVFDATAGLGRDGFILASLGCNVTMCERSTILHALLADGLRRASLHARTAATAKKIRLYHGDSREILTQFTDEERPEVIYLDPMFPSRRKSSLVKKEMQALHILLGDVAANSNLLDCALQYSKARVVCKRPGSAEPLAGAKPHHAIKTKKHRFDVYLQAASTAEVI